MKLKKPFAVILVLAALVGLALYWLSHNLDSLAKNAIQDYGSAMAQDKVRVGAVKLSPIDGRGTIRQLTVGNPKGFKTTHALQAAQIDVELDIATVAKDVIVIHRIAIEAPDVIYEKGEGLTNFDAILRNIASYTNASATPAEKNTTGSQKLIVDLLTIRGAKAQASAAFMNGKTVVIALPDITLRNIGRDQGGVTPGELGAQVAGALKSRLSGAASFDRVVKSSQGVLDKAGSAIKGLFSK